MKTIRILLVLTAITAFAGIGVAYGQTTEPTSIPAISLTLVTVGAFSGAVYGGLGYINDRSKSGEAFNGKQFGLTVGIGAVVGIFVPIAQPTDLNGLVAAGLTAFTSFGAIYFVQKLIGIANAVHSLGKPAPTPVPA